MWFDTKSQPYSKCILRMHTLKIIAYVKLTDEIMDMNVGGNKTQRKTKQLAKGTVFSGFVLIKTYSVRCYRLIRIHAKQNQTKPNRTKLNETIPNELNAMKKTMLDYLKRTYRLWPNHCNLDNSQMLAISSETGFPLTSLMYKE